MGAAGPSILLASVGAVLGAVLGFFGGGFVAYAACGMSESFGCTAGLLVGP
jgi:hypothetical protein